MAVRPVRSFPPIADDRARLLIVGSMPGAASLGAGEYYAHPRNAFWRIMSELFGRVPCQAYADRCERLRQAGVAVWDVLRECRRQGSLDTAIEPRSERANDFRELFGRCPRIERVFFNGLKAETAWRRHVAPTLGEDFDRRLRFARLPSTSPAHAGRTFEEKLACWRVLVRDAR